MEQIIFFTRNEKLSDILVSFQFKEPIKCLNSSTPNSSNKILLVDETQTVDLTEQLSMHTNYLVFHEKTLNYPGLKAILDSEKYKLEDHHQINRTKIYEDLKGIINGFDDQKFEELKMKIVNVKLESALDFLHKCLNGKPIEGLPNDLSNDKTKQLFENLPNDLSDEKYIPALTILRDAILENAGIRS